MGIFQRHYSSDRTMAMDRLSL